MAVKLSIELEALRDPAVSAALANLVRALGPAGASITKAAPAPAPVAAAPVPVTPIAAAPAPVAAAPVAAPAAPVAAPAAPAPKPARTRKAPKAAPTDLSDAEITAGWTSFLEGLPARSQRFLMMIRQANVLTMTAAMAGLNIEQPKAMGGITGAIGRWGPARGLPVPYTATDIDGVRAWRWLGLDTVEAAISQAQLDPSAAEAASATPAKAAKAAKSAPRKAAAQKPAPAKAEPAPAKPTAPVKAKPPIRRTGTARTKRTIGMTGAGKPTTPAKAAPISTAPAAAPAPAPATAAPAKAQPANDAGLHALAAFRADLPEKSQAFLDLVAERGRVSMPEALKFFGLARSIAIGKVTEPIVRLARERGIDLPYDSQRDATLGFRVWEWISAS